MKFLSSQLTLLLGGRRGHRQLRELFRILLAIFVLVALFSTIFQWLMAREGREFSWIDGLYWTIVTMSTLGYGDIVFTSGAGRAFSTVVIVSGLFSLLGLLPFAFIRFFYEPWVEAQAAARAPRELPASTSGHVILTNYDTVTHTLINRLNQYGYPYVLLVKELAEALRLHDLGLNVVVGELDHPQTYRNVRLEKAAMVAVTSNDFSNTNIAFTVRELSEQVPIVTTANTAASVSPRSCHSSQSTTTAAAAPPFGSA